MYFSCFYLKTEKWRILDLKMLLSLLKILLLKPINFSNNELSFCQYKNDYKTFSFQSHLSDLINITIIKIVC